MIEVFQQFGFPIAVAIVSLMAMGFMGRYLLRRMDRTDAKAEKIQDQYTAFLQVSNVELTGALKENAVANTKNAEAQKENAAALKENAAALNRFSSALERFEALLVKYNKD